MGFIVSAVRKQRSEDLEQARSSGQDEGTRKCQSQRSLIRKPRWGTVGQMTARTPKKTGKLAGSGQLTLGGSFVVVFAVTYFCTYLITYNYLLLVTYK